MAQQRPVIISPSILSSNFGTFAESASALYNAGAQTLHIDIMDGHFVPNLSFGAQLVADLRPVSGALFDVHLMVKHPEDYIEPLSKGGANMATIHPETTYHLDRAINEIKASGLKAGVALNPATPLEACEWVLGIVDRVLVMTVNPGFGGQKFIEAMTVKIGKLAEMRDQLGLDFEIAVDGGITAETAPAVVKAGATALIAGSSVFKNPNGPGEGFKALQGVVSSL